MAYERAQLVERQGRTIAELRTAQEQLLGTQERLVRSEQLALVGRFTAGIAHELNNQMSPFLLAELLSSRYPDDQEVRESVDLMLEAKRRIEGLVDEIKNFARGGQTALSLAPHDLVALVEETLRFLDHAKGLLGFSLPLYEREGKAYLTVAVGCTGGRHRSVVVARRLADELREKTGMPIAVLHRDVDRQAKTGERP